MFFLLPLHFSKWVEPTNYISIYETLGSRSHSNYCDILLTLTLISAGEIWETTNSWEVIGLKNHIFCRWTRGENVYQDRRILGKAIWNMENFQIFENLKSFVPEISEYSGSKFQKSRCAHTHTDTDTQTHTHTHQQPNHIAENPLKMINCKPMARQQRRQHK